jgi:putative hemolysin
VSFVVVGRRFSYALRTIPVAAAAAAKSNANRDRKATDIRSSESTYCVGAGGESLPLPRWGLVSSCTLWEQVGGGTTSNRAEHSDLGRGVFV